MRTSWNDEEDDALQGLPLRAQIIYLRGIRRYMDYASRICGGPMRRISLTMLAETAQESVNRQIQPKTTKDGIRASLEQLKRAGLIERMADPDYLLFFLPKADADKPRQNKYPIAAPQSPHNHQTLAEPMPDRTWPPRLAATAPQPAAQHHPTHPDSADQGYLSLPDGRACRPPPHDDRPKKPPPPYQAIVELYHDCLPSLPKVYKLNDLRRRRIKALWDDELEDLNSWRNYFSHIARSDFLMGRTPGRDGSPFLASLDFITHPGKFIKIAEEHYHGKKVQRPHYSG